MTLEASTAIMNPLFLQNVEHVGSLRQACKPPPTGFEVSSLIIAVQLLYSIIRSEQASGKLSPIESLKSQWFPRWW